MNLSGENAKTPHNEGGQNYAKKRMSDYDISLMLTLISIPVWLPTLFVWSFLPIELVPQFINFFRSLASGNMADGILLFCHTLYTTKSGQTEKRSRMFGNSSMGLYD